MELHKDPEGKTQNSASQKQEDQLQDYSMLPMCEDFRKLLYKTAAPTCTHGRQKGDAHLPRRLPGKPSPLRILCGPVPAGFPAPAALSGCPRCAPHCGGGQGRMHSTTIEQYARRGFQMILCCQKCFNGDCFPVLILKFGYFSGQDGQLGYITELSIIVVVV